MKVIGLIGGMSWESTVTYYKVINTLVKQKLGGTHSAKCLLYSVDFAEIEACQLQGQWDKGGQILAQAAQALERGGADFILICTNTMHKVYDQVQASVSIPLLHIAQVTAAALQSQSIKKVALLGTKYTMQQDFYKSMIEQSGIEVITPPDEQMDYINKVIFTELCQGVITKEAKANFLAVIDELAGQGAAGVILGCTEIGLLIGQADTRVPLFDTTLLHAQAAVDKAFS